MGFLFNCDVCPPPTNFQTEDYNQWLDHLVSVGHQARARNNGKLNPRKKWVNEKDSYVLTGISNGLPCSEKQLLEWISRHGFVTEYIHFSNQHYILFTLKSIMPTGPSSVNIVKETKLNDQSLLIKPKSQYGPSDWNYLHYSSKENQSQRTQGHNSAQESTDGSSKAGEPKPSTSRGIDWKAKTIATTSTAYSYPQGASKKGKRNKSKNNYPSASIENQSSFKSTLVFTNKNLSSAGAHQKSGNSKTPSNSYSASNISVNSVSTSDCLSDRSKVSSNSNSVGHSNKQSNRKMPPANQDNSKRKPEVRFDLPSPGTSSASIAPVNSNISNTAVCGSVVSVVNQEMLDSSPGAGGRKKKRRSKQKNKKSKDVSHSQSPANHNANVTVVTHAERVLLDLRGQKGRIKLPLEVPPIQTPLSIPNHFQEVRQGSVDKMDGGSMANSLASAQDASNSNPEPLNFRGGFTITGRSRLDSQRISESSDGSTSTAQVHPFQPNPPLRTSQNSIPVASKHHPHQQQLFQMKNSDSQTSQRNMNPSANVPPVAPARPFTVLQRPVIENRISPNQIHLQQQYSNSAIHMGARGPVPPHQQVRSHIRPPPGSWRAPPQGYNMPGSAPPPLMPNPPHYIPPPGYALHYQRPILITPTFASQVAPEVAQELSNPLNPKSRNPYKFNTPPFPRYFELFQKLPQDNFKPSKNHLYLQFNKHPLAEQLEEFFLAQCLPPSEVLLRWQVILDILVILRQHYPRCELYAFGSILTGLGDFGSDIDVYVDLLGESLLPQPLAPNNKIPSHSAVDSVKKIFRKSLCPHNKTAFVKNLIPVKSARVPILKLTHRATDINCDLSFENRLSVQNSRLLSFYLNIDKRLFRFMVLIRYWAKFHHVTGSNHIKNYALTLLVLVFLCKKGLVPSVMYLQNLKQAERKEQRVNKNPDEIDGWDASFCDNVMKIKQSGFKPNSFPGVGNGNASMSSILIQMAIEFFEMCANLDFSNVVVCPLLGEVLPKQHFEPGNEEDLPETLERYKNWAVKQEVNRRLNINCCLCIQDPFVLSFNVGCVTPLGTLLKFQVACASTAQILAKNSLKSFLDVFVRLPNHVGERKFMKILKTEQKADEFKHEIKKAVGYFEEEDRTKSNQKSSASLTPKLSFVLPDHLKKYERIIDEKSMKAALKKGKWESYLDFSLSSEFESLFIAELARCKFHEMSRKITQIDLTFVMCGLWREFALDFLKSFFEVALKLNVLDKKSVYTDNLSVTPSGRKSRWKLRTLTKKEEEKLLPTKKSMEEINVLVKKILAFEPVPCQLDYRFWNILVDYPFWEKRPSLTVKAGKEMKERGETIRIPLIPSSKEIRREEKEKKRKKKSKEEAKEEESESSQSYIKECFDSISLERRASELVRESLEKLNNEEAKASELEPFKFNAMVRMDASSTTEKPQLVFLFEKDPSSKTKSPNYKIALSTLGNILTDTFPAYQLYRLAEWLGVTVDEPKPDISGNDNELAKEVDNEEDQPSTTTTYVKKKKTRTKLEEDLLIPSSSSSTCSSHPDLNELQDDNVEEEEAASGSDDEDDEDESDNDEEDEENDNDSEEESNDSNEKAETNSEKREDTMEKRDEAEEEIVKNPDNLDLEVKEVAVGTIDFEDKQTQKGDIAQSTNVGNNNPEPESKQESSEVRVGEKSAEEDKVHK